MVKVSDAQTSLDIQTEKEKKRPNSQLLCHPSSQMNQHSLELCTESLGSETGCEKFFSAEEFYPFFSPFCSEREFFEEKAEEKKQQNRRKELTTVKNHCSFPPLLSSAFIQMRRFCRDGHLILKAVSLNYLHAKRHSGRLVLSFISRFVEQDGDDDVDEEEEEEVQVLDRGTVVEVKVSTKPQLVNGVTAMKVLRSSVQQQQQQQQVLIPLGGVGNANPSSLCYIKC